MFNSYVSLPEGISPFIEISSQIIKSMVKPFARTRDWMDCSSILGGRIESKRPMEISEFANFGVYHGIRMYTV